MIHINGFGVSNPTNQEFINFQIMFINALMKDIFCSYQPLNRFDAALQVSLYLDNFISPF